MIRIYTLLWIGLLALAFLNGAIREIFYEEALGELAAHQLSTLTGCLLFFLYAWLVNKRWPIITYSMSIAIGLIWAFLTISFETFMVLALMKKDITRLLHAYNIAKGQLWPIVVLWAAILPSVLVRLNKKRVSGIGRIGWGQDNGLE